MTVLNQQADERQLIEAAQKDPICFADLYEQHMERVYAFVIRRVRNREEAEDLTSEVFHKALANLSSYEWRGAPFAAWLFRIAANAITDRWKQTSREAGNPLPEDGMDDKAVEDLERRAMLARLVRILPEDQRRVVILRFTEQKTIREIAEMMGRTEGAVKQLQFRALQTLRKRRGDTNA